VRRSDVWGGGERGSRRGLLLALVVAASAVVLLGALGLAPGVKGGADSGRAGPREASYWESMDNGWVRCRLCPRECVVPPGERGHCGVRENRNGVYYTLVYGAPVAIHVDPIEKKPFYHFMPGTTAYSIATAGCNLDCKFCQNWQISQALPEDLRSYGLSPQEVVSAALESGAPSIAYTYNEPTIFYEYMLDCARLAHEKGLRNVYHSNGFINEEPLRALCPYLDAANVDLKGMSEEYYHDMTGGSLAPVLRSLKILHDEGVHLEITTLIVPGRNDDPEMIRRQCEWMVANLGPDTPLHFSRFHPEYKLMDLPPTPIETLERARQIALDAGLRYVYVGNVPGHDASDTHCPQCGALLVHRVGYSVSVVGLKDGHCSKCGALIDGVW
jgi:pyruvate formate lyase activating enzyme